MLSDRHPRRVALAAEGLLALAGVGCLVLWPNPAGGAGLFAAGVAALGARAVVHQRALRGDLGVAVDTLLAAASALLLVGLPQVNAATPAVLLIGSVVCGAVARPSLLPVLAAAFAVLVPSLMSMSAWVEALPVAIAIVLAGEAAAASTRALRGELERTRDAADHDGLTGALTRAAFQGRIADVDGQVSPAHPAVLLLIDLDDFGLVNKRSGQLAGDRVLRAAADRIRGAIRPGDELARVGGDEFALLLRGVEPEAVAQRIVTAVGVGAVDGHHVGASIGIALMPQHGRDWEGLLHAAGQALRQAKQRGKRGYATADGLRLLSGGGPGSAAGLAVQAILAGERLHMVVQPIVDLRTGAVRAYEALARFHAEPASPAHWLALADEAGLRPELERLCLRRALALFDARPRDVRLMVNLSSDALLDARTLDELYARRTLRGLVVELTEQALAGDYRQLDRVLRPLLDRGLELAIDDMGAGYSALRHATAMAPRFLKLDRELIREIDREPASEALVDALARYAERTGAELVAEGVETPGELDTVARLGVPLAQGYVLARPGPPWPRPGEVLGRGDRGMLVS